MNKSITSIVVNHLTTLPKELLSKILSYLDVAQIFPILFINKSLNTIIVEAFNTNLFSQIFGEGKFLKHLLSYQLKIQKKLLPFESLLLLQPFTEIESINYFKSYSKEILDHESNKGFLDFFHHAKKEFIMVRSIDNPKSILIRKNLFEKRLIKCIRYLNFLLDHTQLERFAAFYDKENKIREVQSSIDIIFLYHVYQAASELESFFITCLLLQQPRFSGLEWEFFPNICQKEWLAILKGNDLVLLSQKIQRLPNIIEEVLKETIQPSGKLYCPTLEQGNFLLKKLTVDDLITYIQSNVSHEEMIMKSFSIKHPYIITLFFEMSDQQLRDLCVTTRNLGLFILDQPLLVKRLSNESLIVIFNKFLIKNLAGVLCKDYMIARLISPQFLQDLNHEIFWKEDKKNNQDSIENRKFFVEILLSTSEIVRALTLDKIKTLIDSYEIKPVKGILNTLDNEKKFHVTIFFEFIKNYSPSELKNYNHLFTYAFQLASQGYVMQNFLWRIDNDTATPHRLLQFAFWAPEAQYMVCPLLNAPSIVAKLNNKQLEDLCKNLSDSFLENLDKSLKGKLNNVDYTIVTSGPNYQLINHELLTRTFSENSQKQFSSSFSFT